MFSWFFEYFFRTPLRQNHALFTKRLHCISKIRMLRSHINSTLLIRFLDAGGTIKPAFDWQWKSLRHLKSESVGGRCNHSWSLRIPYFYDKCEVEAPKSEWWHYLGQIHESRRHAKSRNASGSFRLGRGRRHSIRLHGRRRQGSPHIWREWWREHHVSCEAKYAGQ